MNYVLIDTATRKPVPLPFESSDSKGSFRVVDFEPPTGARSYGFVRCTDNGIGFIRQPETLGLELITEADFMAEQERRRLENEAEWEFFSDEGSN